jgi:hypothetical protein
MSVGAGENELGAALQRTVRDRPEVSDLAGKKGRCLLVAVLLP